MSYRLTKIYTRKGDAGYTLLGDKPISKDDLLVEAIGALDELNSWVGFVLAYKPKNESVQTCLTQVQNDLFDIGGELHLPEHVATTADKITYLEKQLDALNADLPPLKEFILPGGNQLSAACHIARTVCRRAERDVVHLHRQVPIHNSEIIRYLNRLSDLLFVCARVLNREDNETEKMWDHTRS